MSALFWVKDSKACELGDTNCCGPIAISLATGVALKKVIDLYEKYGRKKRQPSHFYQHVNVLGELGYCIRTTDKTAKTVLTFERSADKSKTYLIRIRGHILCYKHGQIHDWTKGRRHRIREVYEVERR